MAEKKNSDKHGNHHYEANDESLHVSREDLEGLAKEAVRKFKSMNSE